MPNFGGFSWKRLTGISAAKSRLSRAIGIPLTRSGRQRRIGAMLGAGNQQSLSEGRTRWWVRADLGVPHLTPTRHDRGSTSWTT